MTTDLRSLIVRAFDRGERQADIFWRQKKSRGFGPINFFYDQTIEGDRQYRRLAPNWLTFHRSDTRAIQTDEG